MKLSKNKLKLIKLKTKPQNRDVIANFWIDFHLALEVWGGGKVLNQDQEINEKKCLKSQRELSGGGVLL